MLSKNNPDPKSPFAYKKDGETPTLLNLLHISKGDSRAKIIFPVFFRKLKKVARITGKPKIMDYGNIKMVELAHWLPPHPQLQGSSVRKNTDVDFVGLIASEEVVGVLLEARVL